MSTTYLHISLPPLVYMSLAFLILLAVCVPLVTISAGYAFLPLMMKLGRSLKRWPDMEEEKYKAFPSGTLEEYMIDPAIRKEYKELLDTLRDFDFQE